MLLWIYFTQPVWSKNPRYPQQLGVVDIDKGLLSMSILFNIDIFIDIDILTPPVLCPIQKSKTFAAIGRDWYWYRIDININIQLLESPIPAPVSQKAPSINISWTKRGSIDPLVSKMVKNGLIGQNCQNRPKWFQIVQNGQNRKKWSKWPKIVKIAKKLSKVSQNYPKWFQMVLNGPKSSKIVKNGEKRSKR